MKKIQNISILMKNNIPIIIEYEKFLDKHDYPVDVIYKRDKEQGVITKTINYGINGKTVIMRKIKREE